VLAFDLADAKLAAPPSVASINQKTEGESSTVEIVLVGDVDVHSFREDKNYVVDVAFQRAEKTSPLPSIAEALHAPMRAAETRAPPMPSPSPAAMPAMPAAPAMVAPATSDKASAMTSAPPQASEAVPARSAARQMAPEVNPEQAPKMPAASEPPMSAAAPKEA